MTLLFAVRRFSSCISSLFPLKKFLKLQQCTGMKILIYFSCFARFPPLTVKPITHVI